MVDPDNEYHIAPEGWRVPSVQDWIELEEYLIAKRYNFDNSTSGNKIAKALASDGGEWRVIDVEGSVGKEQSTNNSTGFSGLPASSRHTDGLFYDMGMSCFWWSSTQSDAFVHMRSLADYNPSLISQTLGKTHGYSVRLVKDTGSNNAFVVSFQSNGGSVIQTQYVTQGDLAGEPHEPTKAGYVFDGWYKDDRLVNKWNFSTDAVERNLILYAKWLLSVTDPLDGDGNRYTTKQIGNQLWTVENLRTTRYACGTPIPHVTDNTEWISLETPAFCFHSNTTNQDTIGRFGALYNWYVVDPDNEYRIAPDGWRVPSVQDWITLEEYLIANNYNFDNSTSGNKIAKALASDGGEWRVIDVEGSVGKEQNSNNSTGFSGLPASSRHTDGVFYDMGMSCFWWSSTQSDALVHMRSLADYSPSLISQTLGKTHGYSVRLVRNIE